jgi:hypothetical protein
MARSFRKTPCVGATTAPSDKSAKKRGHRALRKAVRQSLMSEADFLPELEEVSDRWNMPKDGKVRVRADWILKKVRKDNRGKKMFRRMSDSMRDNDVAMLGK